MGTVHVYRVTATLLVFCPCAIQRGVIIGLIREGVSEVILRDHDSYVHTGGGVVTDN